MHSTLDSLENHLLPEGGTEHTSAAPAKSGYAMSISKIKDKNNVNASKYYLKQMKTTISIDKFVPFSVPNI